MNKLGIKQSVQLHFGRGHREKQRTVTIAFLVAKILPVCLTDPEKAFVGGMSQRCVLAWHWSETPPDAVSRVLGSAWSGPRQNYSSKTIVKCLVVQRCLQGDAMRLKFIKGIFLGFDSFQKSTYGLSEDQSSPCYDVANLFSAEKK